VRGRDFGDRELTARGLRVLGVDFSAVQLGVRGGS
jgi:hypothetical protein